jgi:hypothetical protein
LQNAEYTWLGFATLAIVVVSSVFALIATPVALSKKSNVLKFGGNREPADNFEAK